MTDLATAQRPGNPYAQPTTAPLGCRHCAVEQRGHGQRWHPTARWHGWVEPTREQIRQRMRQNRGLA